MCLDICHHVKSWHDCQIYSTMKVHSPINIPAPSTMFTKVHMDIMLMAKGYHYIVLVQVHMYVNRRALQKASACTVATFMLEELILQYGYIGKIVTDNGLEFKGALSELLKKCSIPQVDISPYNSQVNGIVQQGHFAIREALVKVYQGDIHLWPDKLQVALFIDNVIVRRSTGYSAYFLLHGTDSVLPFDLWKSTFLVEGFQQTLPCNSWQWSNDQCHRHWSVPMHCVLTKSAKSIVMETANDKQVSHLINRDLGGHPGMGNQSQFMWHLKFFTVEDHGKCW